MYVRAVGTDTYKGESPSKKIARFYYWAHIAKTLGVERFRNGKHLVLSSREGGDISVLLGLGVPPKNIVAVEMNVEAAEQAQEKFPSVHIICDDVFAVAKKHHRGLLSAFLDFCSPVSHALLQKVVGTAAYGLKEGGVLGCGFLAGRERGEFSKSVEEEREYARVLEQEMVALTDEDIRSRMAVRGMPPQFMEAHGLDPEACREHLIQTSKDTLAMRARANLLGGEFVTRGLSVRCVPLAIAYIYYVSATAHSKGVPMLIYAGRVFRAMTGQSIDKLKKRLREFMEEMPQPMPYDLPVLTEDDLVMHTLMLTKTSPPAIVARMLNVPHPTLTAWMAHATRGTYGDRPETYAQVWRAQMDPWSSIVSQRTGTKP